jgi:hypothetical protein
MRVIVFQRVFAFTHNAAPAFHSVSSFVITSLIRADE